MKKLFALLLAAVMVFGCVGAMADAGSEPDWTQYNALITEIKATTDFAKRAEMMHQAEDILMDTGAIVPIYYYNDIYLQKTNVTGIYTSLNQNKYFMYAEKSAN